jgi:hypothetical protein
MVASHYGHGIPDVEIDVHANVISYSATVIFGISIKT